MMELKLYIDEIKLLPNNNVIYALIDPNTKNIRYIGKAENLCVRIRNHYKPSRLKNKTHKNTWINSLLKKEQRVEVSVLEECENIEFLNASEIKWISYYKSIGYDLTNGTEGGTGGRMSPESIAKMVAKKTGMKMSEESKKKMSDASKGHIVTSETRKKIGDANRGKIVSDETKIKLSESHKGQVSWNKGKKMSEESKKKMSDSGKGRVMTSETREKISKSSKGNKSRLGQKNSEEMKMKISESNKQKVKCVNENKIHPSVQECIEYLKISRRKFYKMVNENLIIYI